VKRAEFTRRFGVPGRDGSKVRNDWIAKHGTKDQLDVIRHKIDDEILASGKEPGDAQQLINDMLEANLGILGKVVDERSASAFRWPTATIRSPRWTTR
jgi:hypothetical protein